MPALPLSPLDCGAVEEIHHCATLLYIAASINERAAGLCSNEIQSIGSLLTMKMNALQPSQRTYRRKKRKNENRRGINFLISENLENVTSEKQQANSEEKVRARRTFSWEKHKKKTLPISTTFYASFGLSITSQLKNIEWVENELWQATTQCSIAPSHSNLDNKGGG